MSFFFYNKKYTSSVFKKADYFPAVLEYSNEELNNRFIEYKYKDTDLIEFSINPEDNSLKGFSITLCTHYDCINSTLEKPASQDCIVTYDGPSIIECDFFDVKVFSDGIIITLSKDKPVSFYKSGHLVFSISSYGTLCSLYIVDLVKEEISHVKNELKLQ